MSASHQTALPRVYLPVETAARELDAKLLLTLFLQREGFEVVIGSHARLHNTIHRYPPGIYVAHLFDRKKRRIFRILRDLGHVIVAWDEEGLVRLSAEAYRQRRVDAVALSFVNRVYAWGREQAAVLEPVIAETDTALCLTGNPRQDLYAPALRPLHEDLAAQIRARHGAFVLINSNFGWINHARAPRQGIEKSDAELAAIARESRHPLEYIHFRYRMFRHFCALVPALARRFPERRIVVRPHPSENQAIWRQVAAGLDNVHVVYDHRLVPWLLAAECIVHNGCTTAVEAALLGKIPIDFRPEERRSFEASQPHAVSVPARSIEDVARFVEAPRVLERERPRIAQALSNMVEGWNDGLACRRIAQDLKTLAGQHWPRNPDFRRTLTGQVHARLRMLEKAFLARFVSSSSANPDYIRQKFPPMPKSSIEAQLRRFASLLDFHVPNVEELGENIWRVSSEFRT